jgi:DNA-binding HxlR family transcriptional regulator
MYDGQNCSAARALEVVGERWSLLIIRDALFRGMSRFADFQRSLGIATNVLAKRLDGFVSAGLMERVASGEDAYAEYRLTEKGRDLLPVIVALTKWGDRWAAPDGAPILYVHECGGTIKQTLSCTRCGPVTKDSISVKRGPGARASGRAARR